MRCAALLLCLACASTTLPALDESARTHAREELRTLGGELQKLSRVFNLVHEVVAPSVVAIHTRSHERVPVATPFGVFAGREREVEVGEGSGFVISSDGKSSCILTNSHVVLRMNAQQQFERDRTGRYIGYDRLTVELNDGHQVDAEYVGWSVETDLAVLRVPIPNLPAVEWVDSDQVHVGDWVMALGYPLGVGYSATSGIVSATDRSTGIYAPVGGYEAFIQTDAAINPGNSGGPLVGIDGRIVGVNSNIMSRTGSNIGLGFAIPANLARKVANDLLTHGEVRWPGIGIELKEISSDQAVKSGLPVSSVVIGQIFAETPAAKAGLQAGDVVQAVGGVKVAGPMQFRTRLATCPIGKEVALTLLRDGKQIERSVVPVALDEIRRSRIAARNASEVELKGFGLRLADDGQPGLVITGVEGGSLAAQAGLEPGHRILAEKSKGKIRTLEDVRALTKVREVVLQVATEDRTFWLRMRR